MDVNNNKSAWNNMKTRLSFLWIFLTVNYIFCDVLSVMDPEFLKIQIADGNLSGLKMTQEFLLTSAIMMEIPFIMIVLSKFLNYKVNRIINIIAGTLMTVVQISTFFVGTAPTYHYIFYSVIEIIVNLMIVIFAIRWKNTEKPLDRIQNIA